MIDRVTAARAIEDLVNPVVDSLLRTYPSLPPLMIVGATCRDALHRGLGHRGVLRRTDDLDLAVALDGWHHFDELAARLERTASTSRIRFLVAGVPVDLVPFGGAVEVPDGAVLPAGRVDGPMSVFGFQDVYRQADELELSNTVVRLPSVQGYTLLKVKAWLDRSALGEYKDAQDLATTMFWYQGDPTVVELRSGRLYGSDAGLAHLEAAEFDLDVAAVRLLAADGLALLPTDRQLELAISWRVSDVGLLARNLDSAALPGWPRRSDPRLRQYVAAFDAIIRGGELGT